MNKKYIMRMYAFLFIATLPFAGLAQDTGLVKCGNPGGKPCDINDFFKIFVDIFNYLLGMGAIVAFVFLIYGGIKMFLYSVDEDNLAAGKKTVIEALIGLAIILLAYVLINTLLTVLGVTKPADYFNGTAVSGSTGK
ncbi:MAG: pilin [Candidatus Andersenbacteria bacterium]|nr:pilin [Candidatus Andersenbacteria bacterium]